MQPVGHPCCMYVYVYLNFTFSLSWLASGHNDISLFCSWFLPFLVPTILLNLIYTTYLIWSARQARYIQAKLSVHDRSLKVATVIESLEMEMELLCLTGVEDQLQTDVRPTLEILRNAGIKVCSAHDLRD